MAWIRLFFNRIFSPFSDIRSHEIRQALAPHQNLILALQNFPEEDRALALREMFQQERRDFTQELVNAVVELADCPRVQEDVDSDEDESPRCHR